jgi:NADH-quinone oxidoreductase subunit C
MADETKRNPSEQQAAQGGEKPPAAKPPVPAAAPAATPAAASAATPAAPAAASSVPPSAAAPSAASSAPPAAHAAPPKPTGPAATPWEHERVTRLQQRYGSGIKAALTYLGQNCLVVNKEVAFDVLQTLRDDEKFDYCVDVTCVHYPDRAEPFEVVWILYSFAKNERMRVKASVAENERAPSAVALWPAANWLEREAYDMFGVEFDGHPDMRRILLPDGWKGFPLRKDYDIIQQDKEWVQINLGIESGQ